MDDAQHHSHPADQKPESVPDFVPDTSSIHPDNTPDQLGGEAQHGGLIARPVSSGHISQVPDGWITRTDAHERLSLAGIEVDSRRVRHLCARNELESVKVKNEKNQPQYFINPGSIEGYIAKNRPAGVSGTSPDQPTVDPDKVPDETPDSVQVPDPAQSGQTEPMPDQPVALPGAGAGAGEWVPKAQLNQALETIDFLKEEVRDARQLKRDLKTISSEMLETFALVATNRQLPDKSSLTYTKPVHMDVPDKRPGSQDEASHDGV